jgi:hypothetical protein
MVQYGWKPRLLVSHTESEESLSNSLGPIIRRRTAGQTLPPHKAFFLTLIEKPERWLQNISQFNTHGNTVTWIKWRHCTYDGQRSRFLFGRSSVQMSPRGPAILVFLFPSGQITGYYLKSGHGRFLPLFTIHPTSWQYRLVWAVDTVIKQIINIRHCICKAHFMK